YAIEAIWQQGTWPFWSPLINGGSPVLAMPAAGPLALSTWLGGLVRPEAAIKWSMLLHMLVGMLGVHRLACKLDLEPDVAAVGALAFGLAPFLLDHFIVGHHNIVYPMVLVPWVFLCFWHAITAEQHAHRWAYATGGLIAVQVLEGGDSP